MGRAFGARARLFSHLLAGLPGIGGGRPPAGLRRAAKDACNVRVDVKCELLARLTGDAVDLFTEAQLTRWRQRGSRGNWNVLGA